jgi:hypothetical protein
MPLEAFLSAFGSPLLSPFISFFFFFRASTEVATSFLSLLFFLVEPQLSPFLIIDFESLV